MNAIPRAPDPCIICGQTGDVELHHVAGRAHLPDVVVSVCRTRHVVWHRMLRDAGVVLRTTEQRGEVTRARLITTALGFRVLLEDGAALADDRPLARTTIRAQAEVGLAVIDAAKLGAGPVRPSAPLQARRSSSTPLTGVDERGCRPKAPRDPSERQRRLHAFLSGLLRALAGLLDASLPPELAGLGLPGRLRGIDPGHLALGVKLAGAPGRETKVVRRVARLLDGPEGLSIANIGFALDALVEGLEEFARAGGSGV